MKHHPRGYRPPSIINADPGNPRLGHLEAVIAIQANSEHRAEDGSDHARMKDREHVAPGMLAQQVVPGRDDPSLKESDRLTLGRRMARWISPEGSQLIPRALQDLGVRPPFPVPETDLDEAGLDLQGQPKTLGPVPGEVFAAMQRRADHGGPRGLVTQRGVHVLPARLAQRIVELPSEAVAAERLAVADQIDGGGGCSRVHLRGSWPRSRKPTQSPCPGPPSVAWEGVLCYRHRLSRSDPSGSQVARLSKIYTRTGDAGETGLARGERVPKDGPRIEAIGAIDELNSHLGVLLCEQVSDDVRTVLTKAQHRLFDLGGELKALGHRLFVEFDINNEVTEQALSLIDPDIIIAPFLQRAIPESIWSRHTCIIVHPGIPGDRGPSALVESSAT